MSLAAICAQCGANIEEGAGACRYCGALCGAQKAGHNHVLQVAREPQGNAGIVDIQYPKYIPTQIFGLKWKVWRVYEDCEIEIANSRLGQSLSIDVDGPTEISVSGGNAFGKARATVRGGESYVVKLTLLGTLELEKK